MDDERTYLDILRETPPPMLHMYRGLFWGLVYSQSQTEHLGQQVLEVEIAKDDLDMKFSPSFSFAGSPGFYEEPAPDPEDAVEYEFNPLQFLALAASLDDEAGIVYLNVSKLEHHSEFSHITYYKFSVACTEGDHGVPDDMEWRNFDDHLS